MASIKKLDTTAMAVQAILEGEALLLLEGSSVGTVYPLYQAANRSTEEPLAESTVRGARDGFTESLTMNMSLLRKRIKTPALKLHTRSMGDRTNTSISLVYMEGIIDPKLVEEVEIRLKDFYYRKIPYL